MQSLCAFILLVPWSIAVSMSVSSSISNMGGSNIVVQSQCNCRQIILDITTLPKDSSMYAADQLSPSEVFNCHCPSCRKYHSSAYTSYLRVSKDQVSTRKGHDMIGKFMSACQSMQTSSDCGPREGVVERWYCKKCSSKLLVSVSAAENHQNCLVNLGPLNEDTIPALISDRWKQQLKRIENNLCINNSSCWANALPYYMPPSTKSTWTGSCSCGSCQYEIDITRAAQFQHCYCHICRELSGGPFATWIPIYKRDFTWKKPQQQQQQLQKPSPNNDALSVVRTTKGGSRHICKHCRGVLTIVYDGQPDLIWPCAGSLDDASLPTNSIEIGRYLKRECHICCRHQPSWMDLPDDGMKRIADAC